MSSEFGVEFSETGIPRLSASLQDATVGTFEDRGSTLRELARQYSVLYNARYSKSKSGGGLDFDAIKRVYDAVQEKAYGKRGPQSDIFKKIYGSHKTGGISQEFNEGVAKVLEKNASKADAMNYIKALDAFSENIDSVNQMRSHLYENLKDPTGGFTRADKLIIKPSAFDGVINGMMESPDNAMKWASALDAPDILNLQVKYFENAFMLSMKPSNHTDKLPEIDVEKFRKFFIPLEKGGKYPKESLDVLFQEDLGGIKKNHLDVLKNLLSAYGQSANKINRGTVDIKSIPKDLESIAQSAVVAANPQSFQSTRSKGIFNIIKTIVSRTTSLNEKEVSKYLSKDARKKFASFESRDYIKRSSKKTERNIKIMSPINRAAGTLSLEEMLGEE